MWAWTMTEYGDGPVMDMDGNGSVMDIGHQYPPPRSFRKNMSYFTKITQQHSQNFAKATLQHVFLAEIKMDMEMDKEMNSRMKL